MLMLPADAFYGKKLQGSDVIQFTQPTAAADEERTASASDSLNRVATALAMATLFKLSLDLLIGVLDQTMSDEAA